MSAGIGLYLAAPPAPGDRVVETETSYRPDGGWAARGYGPYAPGGNPVLQGPRRATRDEAMADAAEPGRVLE